MKEPTAIGKQKLRSNIQAWAGEGKVIPPRAAGLEFREIERFHNHCLQSGHGIGCSFSWNAYGREKSASKKQAPGNENARI